MNNNFIPVTVSHWNKGQLPKIRLLTNFVTDNNFLSFLIKHYCSNRRYHYLFADKKYLAYIVKISRDLLTN